MTPPTSFHWMSSIFSSAVSPEVSSTNGQIDLISVLSVAQQYKVDFLPITWLHALGPLGRGATAEISQSLISIQTGFAFKRSHSPTAATSYTPHEVDTNLRTLVSELLVLENPLIRCHPNIIDLQGICWEVKADSEDVWPVLVFERAQLGDLQMFMDSEDGRNSSFDARIELCIGIAKAIMTMHGCNIVHGDIKPQNVLIFKDKGEALVAKVADFGYSCLGVKDDDVVRLPMSRPWNAPEWHHREFRIYAAKKTDVYSFGMLCLWVLFRDELLRYVADAEANTMLVSTDRPWGGSYWKTRLEELKKEDKLTNIADELISRAVHLTAPQRVALGKLFEGTLCRDWKSRESDFEKLINFLNRDTVLSASVTELDNHVDTLPHSDFHVAASMRQLSKVDYRVRSKIVACLKAIASDSARRPSCDTRSRNAAFQLAFCHKVGFGVRRDETESQIWLEHSLRQQDELEYEFELLKREEAAYFRESSFSQLWDRGYIFAYDFPQHYREQQQSNNVEPEYRREIADMSSALGDSNPITLCLKSTLSSILQDQGSLEQAEALALQVVDTQKTVLGVEHLSTLENTSSLASIYRDQGRLSEAEQLELQVMKRMEARFGEGHPNTIGSMTNLALIYWHQSRWNEAEMLAIQALGIRKRILGVNHPETLINMGNLASIYDGQGRWKDAEELHVHVLESRKKVLPDTHPAVLISISNLALNYAEQGRWEEAEKLEVQVLEIEKQVLGVEHIDTLISMGNLALVYYKQGRWNAAEELELQILKIRKRILGIRHPDTLVSTANLASTYEAQGRWKEAEELKIQVLSSRRTVLGIEHPETLKIMDNLASNYLAQGRWKDAEELLVQALEVEERVMGVEHPDTLISKGNLASIYRKQGQWKKAEMLLMQVAEAMKRVLGDKHPDTLTCLNNLALTYWDQAKWDKAEALQSQILEERRVLGSEHPDTLVSMANLSSTYASQGRWEEAEKLQVGIMETRQRTLGAEHPSTLTSMSNLALTYSNQMHWKKAEELGLQVVEIQKRLLGDEHPDTLRSTGNLAMTYWNQGRLKEAEELEVHTLRTRRRVLSVDHPETILSMRNLSETYRSQERWKEAEDLGLQAMEAEKRWEEAEELDASHG